MIKTLGIDLGKNSVHVAAMDAAGRVVLRRKLSRAKLLAWLSNQGPCLIGMEASCGAHHLARQLAAQGHDVRLMPAQYVKPFVKTNKHDHADAEAIGEAVQRPQMRFVPIKTAEQLDLQALHRARDRLVAMRTALINQLRGFLLERGIALPQGPRRLAKALPELLAPEGGLGSMLAGLAGRLREQWLALDEAIAALDTQVHELARNDATARRLTGIPGIGALTATALVAAVDRGQAFARARDLACWLGLVPRQHSTGGKDRLLAISKRGNGYLRRLLVHAARSFQRVARGRDDRLGAWLRGLEARRHRNVATVALAAKLARICWVLMTRKESYRAATA
jgi:transposase